MLVATVPGAAAGPAGSGQHIRQQRRGAVFLTETRRCGTCRAGCSLVSTSARPWPGGRPLDLHVALPRRCRETVGPGGGRGARGPPACPAHPSDQSGSQAPSTGPGGVRINKCLRHVASRRESDRLVEAGRISINGRTATHGAQVHPGDTVEVDGQPVDWERLNIFQGDGAGRAQSVSDDNRIQGEERFTYIKFHKPAGVVCTTDRSIRDNIVDVIGHPERIFPVGRLDKATTGLLLLTSDGRVVNAVCRAAGGHAKTYWVRTVRPITESQIRHLASGVFITTRAQRDGGTKELTARTLPCQVSALPDGPNCIEVTLREGRNRQIRRMLAAIGHEVTGLHRVSVMGLSVAGLAPGQWERLSSTEMDVIRNAVEQSEKTEKTSTDVSIRYQLPQSETDWEEADRSLRGGTAAEAGERLLAAKNAPQEGRGYEPAGRLGVNSRRDASRSRRGRSNDPWQAPAGNGRSAGRKHQY